MPIRAIFRIFIAYMRPLLGSCALRHMATTSWKYGHLNPKTDRFAKIVGHGFHCLAAVNRDRICGYGSIEIAKSQLTSLFVHPEWAGTGVGTLLLKALEQRALTLGLKNLAIEASLNARNFYERNGYRADEVRKARFSTGLEIDCVWMKKSL